MNKKKMEGKVAIVTGAGSGIGRAVTLGFVGEGARVAIIDIDEKAGAETFSMVREAGGDAFFMRADVSQENDVKAMVDEVIRKYGKLDYAANNAGIEGDQGLTADQSTENWDKVININLKGIFLCMKYEIPQMLNHKYGAIVNMSSVAGLSAYSGAAPYCASKHGIIGLTKTAAIEYAKMGIRVNAVCPGAIKTPMTERIFRHGTGAEKEMMDMEPVGRLGLPQEIAEAVIWLCSDAASFVTGYPMAVDGGLIAS